MSLTRIMPCSCQHTFQDSRYGKGKRVFNKSQNEDTYRCTVCRSERKVK